MDTQDPDMRLQYLRQMGLVWERGQGLIRDEQYRVITKFEDAYGNDHPVGEEWTLLGSDFVIYDIEYLIYVRNSSGERETIPLRVSQLVNHFERYVARVAGPFRDKPPVADDAP